MAKAKQTPEEKAAKAAVKAVKKTSEKKGDNWLVVQYKDNVCAAIHYSDYSKEDERIKIVSEHKTLIEAQEARNSHCDKNEKLINQK